MSTPINNLNSQPIGWVKRLAILRRSVVSTVILIETSDNARIKQIIDLDHDALFGYTYKYKLLYNIQMNIIKNLKTGEIIDPQGPPIQYLDSTLSLASSLIIISHVLNNQHSAFLSDPLVYWSQNPDVYKTRSTILVITGDISLFPEYVQRMVGIVSIPVSTEEERREKIRSVIDVLSKNVPLSVNEQELQMLTSISRGLTLHDTETATLQSFFETQKILPEYFTRTKIQILQSMGLTYIEPRQGFEAIGGYKELKEYIMNNIVKVIQYPEKARALGLSIPRGIILAGLPGTGKTVFARALAKELGIPMVQLDPSDFLRGIVGETERRVKQITTVIESLSPIVVFIDEIDQLFMSREKMAITDSGVSMRLINSLLSYLGSQERQAFIIGTTNFISNLDPAFLRPGRVDEVLIVPLPDSEARKEIIQVHTNVIRKIPLASDVNIQEIVRSTEYWTGAEIEKLVLTSARLAFKEDAASVTMKHFEQAFQEFEVNVQERQRALQRLFNEAQRLENVNKSLLKRIITSDERVKSLLKQL